MTASINIIFFCSVSLLGVVADPAHPAVAALLVVAELESHHLLFLLPFSERLLSVTQTSSPRRSRVRVDRDHLLVQLRVAPHAAGCAHVGELLAPDYVPLHGLMGVA